MSNRASSRVFLGSLGEVGWRHHRRKRKEFCPVSVELSFNLLSVVASCCDPAGKEIFPIHLLEQQLAVPATISCASGSPGKIPHPVWVQS